MRTVAHSVISLRMNQCANGFIFTPLQQSMSTGNIPFFLDRPTHNPCHPDTDSAGMKHRQDEHR